MGYKVWPCSAPWITSVTEIQALCQPKKKHPAVDMVTPKYLEVLGSSNYPLELQQLTKITQNSLFSWTSLKVRLKLEQEKNMERGNIHESMVLPPGIFS